MWVSYEIFVTFTHHISQLWCQWTNSIEYPTVLVIEAITCPFIYYLNIMKQNIEFQQSEKFGKYKSNMNLSRLEKAKLILWVNMRLLLCQAFEVQSHEKVYYIYIQHVQNEWSISVTAKLFSSVCQTQFLWRSGFVIETLQDL